MCTIAFQVLPEVAAIDAKLSYTMNISHITDLHFGTDRSVAERDERHCTRRIDRSVQGLEPDLGSLGVCVSGDWRRCERRTIAAQ